MYTNLSMGSKVALLAEGVDRNDYGGTPGFWRLKSPSSRRAWIEIAFVKLPAEA